MLQSKGLTWLTPEELITRQWVKSLISLSWVPFTKDWTSEILIVPEMMELRHAKSRPDVLAQYMEVFVRLALRDVYIQSGWDVEAATLEEAKANFIDAEEWKKKKQIWMEETRDLLHQAYTESWDWSKIRNGIGGGIMNSPLAKFLDTAWPDDLEIRQLEL